ncbi:MAG: general secretion pathway protein GspE [Candidatus Sericytochromatia bacterium]|nr:MAG: general secretion pathway protein GspE [Candidatus Sericytochromatia bacterium]
MDKIIKILLESGDINTHQLQVSLDEHVRTGKELLNILVEKGFITNSKLKDLTELSFISDLNVKTIQIPPDTLKMLPLQIISANKVFPLHFINNKLVLGMVNPKDLIAVDNVNIFLGKNISIQRLRITEEDYLFLLKKYEHLLNDKKDKDDLKYTDFKENEDEDNYEKIFNKLLQSALKKRATQITLEPGNDTVKVRFKIDDTFYEEVRFPKKFYQNLLNYVKENSTFLDSDDKNLYYSGSFKYKENNDNFTNFVFNGIKTIQGERIIIRPSYPIPELRKLFYFDKVYEYIDKSLAKNKGIIIVIGNSASGKSTTLYSLLQHKISNTNQLITVEDPVKYVFDNYVSQINFKMDRVDSLKNFINELSRQSPDVLMLQELKDEEWGMYLEELALSGMLIFAGIKAYNIISAMKKLKRMKFPNFSSIQLLIHQKLLKMLCPYCKVKYNPLSQEIQKAGLTFEQISIAFESNPEGCNKCYGGYKGLIGVFEVTPVTKEMVRILNKDEIVVENFIEEFNKSKIISLKEYGLFLLKDGIISFDEFYKLL